MAATLHLKQGANGHGAFPTPQLSDNISTLDEDSDASMDRDNTLITPTQNTFGLCLFLMLLERIQPRMTIKIYGVVVHSFNLLITLVIIYFLESRVVSVIPCPVDPKDTQIVAICFLIVFYGLMTSRLSSCISHLFGIFSTKIVEKWPDQIPKYVRLTVWDQFVYVLIIVIPEFAIWCSLIWIGSRYILKCDSPEDMALRTMVLLFISRINEVIYRFCTPTLIKNAWMEWKVLRYKVLYVPETKTKASLFQTGLFVCQLVLLLPWLMFAVMMAMMVCP